MRCEELKVVNLNITEDNYEYKALFRLCTDDICIDIDLAELHDDSVLKKIKKIFKLDESEIEISEIIMNKVMDASKLESRNNQGEDCCNDDIDEGIQTVIDSLSKS